MRTKACFVGWAILAIVGTGAAQTFHPDIPRAWDDKEVERFEVPLAQRDRSPRYMTGEEYYALKVRPIYRSYPSYAPGREPAGYVESLKQKEPEIIFDPSKLHTKEDWIRAGQVVFEAGIAFVPARTGGAPAATGVPLSKEGIIQDSQPGSSYIVRRKGVLEGGANSCAGCHTRVMPDGSLIEGAQGNFGIPTISDAAAAELRQSPPEAVRWIQIVGWNLYGAPWVTTQEEFDKSLTVDAYILQERAEASQPGVFSRQGTSQTHPARIPSLIGIEVIRYLDSTGLVRHREIGDLMRYAIVNTGLDMTAHYGDFQPSAKPAPFSGEEGTRFSDEQLYALALYIYSLKPPPNPNSPDERAKNGQRVFQQQGCGACHPAPLYTNNKLSPATGFQIPDDLNQTLDIMNVSVGTDPFLAMQTRRGTGFYKVPSLRGVWYRSAFGHGGQANTLEEWFDPARLKEDYVPKGFHLGPGPIKGHEFGLKLALDDRQALIAFLRTL